MLQQKAKNTTKKEATDYNRLKRYFATINEKRGIEEIQAPELDKLLRQFFMTAKNLKGNLYEPDTLTGMRNSFQRILEIKKSKNDLRKGQEFVNSRKVLSSRRKELTKLGKGNKPNATRPLSENVGYFGVQNPVTLQRTIWWIVTKHFGHRARDEARQLKYGDIKLEISFETGEEYLVWDTERSTKTRTGERPMGHQRSFNPKAFASKSTDRCPVKIYKEFISHRPSTMCNPESPFFLAVSQNADYENVKIWYQPRPLGKNKVGEFMSKANGQKVANHSARKTCITNLLNNNVNPIHVAQLSGHKKVNSLQSYNVASISQQKKCQK